MFESENIADLINFYCDQQELSHRKVANSARIHTSYFSRVMAGRARFSADQLFLIGKVFQLEDTKLEYFLLLGEWCQAGNLQHKNYLYSKMQLLRKQQARLVSKLKAPQFIQTSQNLSTYYEEVITAKIHMYLTIDEYRKKTELLLSKLSITKQKLASELAKLESLGIITYERNAIKLLSEFVHLDDEHPLSPRNHVNWRLDSIQNITARSGGYQFSVAFSAKGKILEEIQKRFKDLVVDVKEKVETAQPPDSVHYMCFDLW